MSDTLELRSQHLHALLAPSQGGRVASLRSLASNVEFLLQPHRPFTPVQPGPYANFADGACAGVEECLPTVGACMLNGEQIPDHGDLWQLPWRLEASTPTSATLATETFSRPLHVRKTAHLLADRLRLDYRIENIGAAPTSFLYATHPLLAVDPCDRILLPQEVSNLTLHGSRHNRVGQPGEQIAWPVTASCHDLSQLLEPTAATAEMLYTGRLQTGLCGLYRATHAQGIVFRFDTLQLPFLGLWICCGGWPERGPGPYQYAFAPEPTTAPAGTLAQATCEGRETTLQPGGTFDFTIDLCISPPGLTLEEFTQFAYET